MGDKNDRKERGRKGRRDGGVKGQGSEEGEGLTAMVVAGRKNIVTAAIPFMTSLWVSMTLESC